MSRFETDFAVVGLPQLLFEFGQAATYSPVTGDDVSLTAIVEPEKRRIDIANGVRESVRTRKATITNDPSSTFSGVVAASEAGKMTIGSEEWEIETLSSTQGGWILELIRPESTRQSRPGFNMTVI